MQIEKLRFTPGNRQLYLCFNGWSASPELFRRLEAEAGWDVWVAYDYRSLEPDLPEGLERYEVIRVVAWSLGVWVAERLLPVWMAKSRGKIRWEVVAVNGTGSPVDDEQGIPVAIFKGTLEQLDNRGLERFNRRMCGSREAWEAYRKLPARPLEEVRDELASLYEAIVSHPLPEEEELPWRCAYLSLSDRIFPIENLRRWWTGRCPVVESDTPHEPFSQWNSWSELWRE